MKVALTSVFSNIVYSDKNHRGLEAVYFKQLLEENGYEVDLVGKKGRNSKDFDFYKNYDQDFSEYDALFIQLSPANFFGGVVGEHTESIARSIAGFNGPIYALVNDPRIGFYNPVEKLKRFDLIQDLEEEWNSIIENATYLFPGKKIEKYLGHVPKNWQRLDWFTYMFKHKMAKSVKAKQVTPALFDWDEEPAQKEYDLLYYGDNRGSFREKQVAKYFKSDTNNLLVGFKTKKASAEFTKKQPHNELLQTISKCKASLITGDEEHMDNVITFRFYETMGSDCLAAIQIEYDPDMELIQDPILREKLYVRSSADVKNLVDSYSDELIERQKQELRNIFDRLDITFKINL